MCKYLSIMPCYSKTKKMKKNCLDPPQKKQQQHRRRDMNGRDMATCRNVCLCQQYVTRARFLKKK